MPDPTRETISATQTPALFGVSPYLTRWMLLRHFMHGDEISDPANNRMDWGSRLEPLILEQAGEDLHFEVKRDQQYVRNGLIGCTRDATVICPSRGPGSLETKCVFDYRVWFETWSGGVPPRHIEIQLQQQMMIGDGSTPYEWGVLAVWLCGEVKYFERKPLRDLWAGIRAEASSFFDDVRDQRAGDPFGEPVEMPLMARLFPPRAERQDLTTADGADKLAEEARMLVWHADERLGHDKAEKRIKALLKAAVGTASETVLPGGVIVRQKLVNRAGFAIEPSSYVKLDVYAPESEHLAPKDNILHAG